MKLSSLIRFRSDLLFEGAVQADWFENDSERSRLAASHFVFHGPDYHGVKQTDLGGDTSHKLIDTATFSADLFKRLSSPDAGGPFSLAIAGYGTGKSHLALTLANLLSATQSDTSKAILGNIGNASKIAGEQIVDAIESDKKPFMVCIINGMGDFDLAAELTRQMMARLCEFNLDSGPIENLRPRFKSAAKLIQSSFYETIRENVEQRLPGKDRESIVLALKNQNETVFSQVSAVFEEQGIPIRSIGRESIQELISTVCRNYCGENKPFRGLVILFDEFGRYLEFATQRAYIAGAGSVQQLFEGVQANGAKTQFMGFIQYELSSYAERVAPEHQNEIVRFVTRFQTAKKHYLSVNLETLIAHFLQKKDPEGVRSLVEKVFPKARIENLQTQLKNWFPEIENHALWTNPERFEQIIVHGCWPLHPAAVWLLYHLGASGKHLQQRSALSILKEAMDGKFSDNDFSGEDAFISAAGLWSSSLTDEFIRSEESERQVPVTHAFSRIMDRYGSRLSMEETDVLRSVVLGAKLHLQGQSGVVKKSSFPD